MKELEKRVERLETRIEKQEKRIEKQEKRIEAQTSEIAEQREKIEEQREKIEEQREKIEKQSEKLGKLKRWKKEAKETIDKQSTEVELQSAKLEKLTTWKKETKTQIKTLQNECLHLRNDVANIQFRDVVSRFYRHLREDLNSSNVDEKWKNAIIFIKKWEESDSGNAVAHLFSEKTGKQFSKVHLKDQSTVIEDFLSQWKDQDERTAVSNVVDCCLTFTTPGDIKESVAAEGSSVFSRHATLLVEEKYIH